MNLINALFIFYHFLFIIPRKKLHQYYGNSRQKIERGCLLCSRISFNYFDYIILQKIITPGIDLASKLRRIEMTGIILLLSYIN